MITATKPFVPDIQLYTDRVARMFEKAWFTNFGDYVIELEQKLADYFATENFLLVTNGTISLQLAIKALELKGEIITTPFSYIATTSAIVWENCTPVFADIDPRTFNIDPAQIERCITKDTTAILATNVFGYPCDFSAIMEIAAAHGLKVIYDSAHVFGTTVHGKSILQAGDISSVSFHATKLFHTIEGGGIFCKTRAVYDKLKLLRNFGHTSPSTFGGLGINAKMNEACAAMGLSNFGYITQILARRKEQWLHYKHSVEQPLATFPEYDLEKVDYNYSYFPVVMADENRLLKKMEQLLSDEIQTRRYFYPSLNTLEFVRYRSCPVSEDISRRIFCLPMYHDLSREDQDRIIDILNKPC